MTDTKNSSIETKYQTFIKKDWEYERNVARAVALATAQAVCKTFTTSYLIEVKAKKIARDADVALAQKKIKGDILLRHPELETLEQKTKYVQENYLRVVIEIIPYEKKDVRERQGI